MDYRKVIIAHRGFYELEPRAKYYDQYMRDKSAERWNQPELPIEEIDSLFSFIIHWDHHFKGDKERFREFYYNNFNKIKQLQNISLYDLDTRQQDILDSIRELFSGVANCGIGGRFESTDASKILQTINPRLFVMWDDKIKIGILGNDSSSGPLYAYKFLPMMKRRLDNIIEFTIKERGGGPTEVISYIESYCDGKTMAKLLDEYNYMVHTMSTEFSNYLSKRGVSFKDFTAEKNLNVDLPPIRRPSGEYGRFIQLLDEVRAMNLIDAKERRRLEKEWRDSPDRQSMIEEELNFLKTNLP